MSKQSRKRRPSFRLREDLNEVYKAVEGTNLEIEVGREIEIETKRLFRHVIYLQKRQSENVARDLAVALRCFSDIARSIDEFCEINNVKLIFCRRDRPNYVKGLYRQSVGRVDYFDEPLKQRNGLTHSNSFIALAQGPYEIANAYNKTQKLKMVEQSVSEWLATAIFEETVVDKNTGKLMTYSFSRGKFIDRAANTLGGAHSTLNYSIKEAEANSKGNAALDNILISYHREIIYGIPAPHAHLITAGSGLLRALAALFEDSGKILKQLAELDEISRNKSGTI